MAQGLLMGGLKRQDVQSDGGQAVGELRVESSCYPGLRHTPNASVLGQSI